MHMTVNGTPFAAIGRAAQDARRLPARGLPAHRHAPRLRARRVRCVHRAARRRRGARVPRCSRCRPTAPTSPRSRARRRPTASCHAVQRGVPRRPRPAVRVLHARVRRVDHRLPARPPRSDRRRDPRRAVGQPLPLHRLPGHHRRRAPRRGRRSRGSAVTEAVAGGRPASSASASSAREDARLLTGHGGYVDDIVVPGMLHCAFVRSDIARGAIRGIDTSAARALPGVSRVFTGDDLNAVGKELWHTSIGARSPETPRPPLADGDVRFVGEPVGSWWPSPGTSPRTAAELIDVDIEAAGGHRRRRRAEPADAARPPRLGSTTWPASFPGPRSRRSTRSSPAPPTSSPRPSPSTATCACRWRPAASCRLGPGAPSLTVWISTQAPHGVRSFLASARPGRASHPRHHGRRGRWLRPEDVHAARRGGRRFAAASAWRDR